MKFECILSRVSTARRNDSKYFEFEKDGTRRRDGTERVKQAFMLVFNAMLTILLSLDHAPNENGKRFLHIGTLNFCFCAYNYNVVVSLHLTSRYFYFNRLTC